MFSLGLFMISFTPSVFAMMLSEVSTIPDGAPLPVYENGGYTISIRATINYVEVRKDNVLVQTYQRNVNYPTDEKLFFDSNGSYEVEQYYSSDSPVYEFETRFKISGVTEETGGTGGTTTPAIDYSDVLSSINSNIDLTNTNLSGSLSRLDNVISQVSRVDGSLGSIFALIDAHFNNALNKMNTTNSILGMINNELQTDIPVPYEYEEDYIDDLESARPSQNQQSFADNTQYFSTPAETVVSQTMPQATEPQQWDGVESPEAMQAEESLSSESELFKDIENVKDIELTKDQFTKTEEMTQDNNYSADSPLTQDSFSADGEMTKDNFSNTEQYSKENEMQQTENYSAVPNNPNLRWKSVNGQFQ